MIILFILLVILIFSFFAFRSQSGELSVISHGEIKIKLRRNFKNCKATFVSTRTTGACDPHQEVLYCWIEDGVLYINYDVSTIRIIKWTAY